MITSIISSAKLTRQVYGLNMAQGHFGGPKGIWLECSCCNESQTIVGSVSTDSVWASISDEQAAQVFINHGWTGKGAKLTEAKCPKCSKDNNMSVPMSGRVFTSSIRKIANDNSELDHNFGFSQKLEDLGRMLDMSDTMAFIDHSSHGLYVSFSKDNGKTRQYTKDISVQDLEVMAHEIFDWCKLKGIFQ